MNKHNRFFQPTIMITPVIILLNERFINCRFFNEFMTIVNSLCSSNSKRVINFVTTWCTLSSSIKIWCHDWPKVSAFSASSLKVGTSDGCHGLDPWLLNVRKSIDFAKKHYSSLVFFKGLTVPSFTKKHHGIVATLNRTICSASTKAHTKSVFLIANYVVLI